MPISIQQVGLYPLLTSDYELLRLIRPTEVCAPLNYPFFCPRCTLSSSWLPAWVLAMAG